ncbi:MAG: four helix bundle protein [Flavobacteriales bacterium]|nr:four helix bundle protein [Flavobacteriales bacterium]MBK7555023.1 four helix bundle protein [Flavobacteriales bacterium]MBK9194804.1 four helix bundle protein [Flavobacteriales bacterium]
MERKYDIEDRCIVFGAAVVKHTDNMPNTRAGNHLAGQLLRSGTAPALHYGEVQGAESPRDFIHKMSGALKELRESKNNMRVQLLAGMMDLKNAENAWLLKECGELVAIFTSSIKTAERNNPRK